MLLNSVHFSFQMKTSIVFTLLILMASCNVPHKIPDVPTDESLSKATFAGGCFWCMEPAFEKLKGVRAVISGYTGGKEEHPTYEQVSSGTTGHVEAEQVY